jgi:formate hydrogenlyase subunit 6/NADH:ubiquinone oxidoreductase subunit I
LDPSAIGGKGKRVRLLAVITEACTGCGTCVDFCPVDCIDGAPNPEVPGTAHPAVQIHEDECVGCEVCARVCEELTWNAIEMVPAGEFERRSGLRFSEQVVGGEAPLAAPAAST